MIILWHMMTKNVINKLSMIKPNFSNGLTASHLHVDYVKNVICF